MEKIDKGLRSVRQDLFTPCESAILNAQYELEKVGADLRLTEASILLSKARQLVTDYLYEKEQGEEIATIIDGEILNDLLNKK